MSGQPLIDAANERILSLPIQTEYSEHGIVSRIVLNTPIVRVVIFGFAAGQQLTEHTSTSDALVQILSGDCDFIRDGAVHHLKAGDYLHIPPGVRHAMKATHQFSMLLTLLNATNTSPTINKPSTKFEKPGREVSLNVK